MGTEAFTGSRLRLQWAKEGLDDFKRCVRDYLDGDPCTQVVEPDPDGLREHHKLRFREPFPRALTKHTVHIIEDLRSALDLTAIEVARLADLPVDDVHFPFCKTAADFKSRIGSCCKGFPEEITRLFASFEPYGRTDNLVFAINELCNTSKHQIVVPVASVVGVELPYIESTDSAGGRIELSQGGIFNGEKNEITYATTKRGHQWKYHAQFCFGVAFGDVGPLKAYPVVPNLDAMIGAVEMIINETEAEARRLRIL